MADALAKDLFLVQKDLYCKDCVPPGISLSKPMDT